MKRTASLAILLALVVSCLTGFWAAAEPAQTAESDDLNRHLISHWDFAGTDPLADKAPAGTTSDTVEIKGSSVVTRSGTLYIPDYVQGDTVQYVSIADSPDLLRSAEDRTFFIVFKTDKTFTTEKSDSMELASQNGALRLGVQNSGAPFISTNPHAMGENRADTSGMTCPANTWITLAVAYEKREGGATVSTFFRAGDGDWVATSGAFSDATQTWQEDNSDAGKQDGNALNIGRNVIKSYKTTWGGNLTIDDIRIYDKALSGAEVETLNHESADGHLISHWNFAGSDALADKAEGGSTVDSMQLFGAASVRDGMLLIPDSVNGNTVNYAQIADSADSFRSADSRTLFIRFKSDKTYQNTDRMELISQNGALRVGVKTDGGLFAGTNPHAMGENTADVSGMTYAPNRWITLAIAYDKSPSVAGQFHVAVYFQIGDDAWVETMKTLTDATQTWLEDNSDAGKQDGNALNIGRNVISGFATAWGGNLTIDDLRIYDTALSLNQVRDITVTNPTADITSAGHSLTLDGGIGVNFYLTFAGRYLFASPLRVTVRNGERLLTDETVTLTDAEPSEQISDAYRFTAAIAAKEMTDTLTLTVSNASEKVLYTETYSAKAYADTMLADAEAYSAETVALVKAMLCYGGEAQRYFGYQTDRLADEGLALTLPELPDAADWQSETEGSLSCVASVSATLKLDSRLRIVFRVALADEATDAELTCTGGDVVRDGRILTVTTDEILPTEYGTAKTLTLTDGTDTLTVRYSPMTYLTHQKDNARVEALAKALYAYRLAAEGYAAE
ncbi:MAG TPA: hypothetical protein DDW30_01110 [Clostridiales bacterium]|mgnify:CR=1 FL=1|nr:hypothetical protein [Clostridiales bacterium]